MSIFACCNLVIFWVMEILHFQSQRKQQKESERIGLNEHLGALFLYFFLSSLSIFEKKDYLFHFLFDLFGIGIYYSFRCNLIADDYAIMLITREIIIFCMHRFDFWVCFDFLQRSRPLFWWRFWLEMELCAPYTIRHLFVCVFAFVYVRYFIWMHKEIVCDYILQCYSMYCLQYISTSMFCFESKVLFYICSVIIIRSVICQQQCRDSLVS